MHTLVLLILAAIALIIVVWAIVIVPANNLRRKMNRKLREQTELTSEAIEKCSFSVADMKSFALSKEFEAD